MEADRKNWSVSFQYLRWQNITPHTSPDVSCAAFRPEYLGISIGGVNFSVSILSFQEGQYLSDGL